ncbi:MAG TPA: GYD domain-containing protein [Acidimicrobiales bacterium]|nr:GYD domain-containing protein [Acidimicrobiales bacterium]
MGHYMFRASYTVVGLKGVLKEGASSRAAMIKELTEKAGGRFEAIYWAFGDDDVIVIAELPDNTTAAAFATAVSASGAVTAATTVLITADEMDAAAKINIGYRAPGA